MTHVACHMLSKNNKNQWINYPSSDVFKINDVLRQDKLMVEHKPLSSSWTALRSSVCFGGARSLWVKNTHRCNDIFTNTAWEFVFIRYTTLTFICCCSVLDVHIAIHRVGLVIFASVQQVCLSYGRAVADKHFGDNNLTYRQKTC